MDKCYRGHQWLDALNYKFYFFLDEKFVPDEETKTYIKEKYKNNISGYNFGYFRLFSNARHKVVVEGWGFCADGVNGVGSWPTKQLELITKEPQQRTREFETVIKIRTENGIGPMCCLAGRHTDTDGFFKLNVTYVLLRRALKIDPPYNKLNEDEGYDYYNIPRGKDILSYMPNESDNTSFCYGDNYILYDEDKLKILEYICDAGRILGDNLNSLFANKGKLLTMSNKNLKFLLEEK